MTEEQRLREDKRLEQLIMKRLYEIDQSQRLLKFCKKIIEKKQIIGSDYNIEFRRGLLKTGFCRISFYNWFHLEIHFKQKNIDKVKQYLTDLGEVI